MTQSYGSSTGSPQQRPRSGGNWAARVIVVAVLLSLVFGGIAGGVIGGGATYLVMTWRESGTRQASIPPTTQPLLPSPISSTQEETYSFTTVAERVGPAVVTVVNTMKEGTDPFGFPGQAQQAEGSGVIVDARGYIITNYHVVENAADLNVVFPDGTRKPAKLIGHDYPFSDLAVIKVDGEEYPYAALGDSDALRVGEPVVAIGSALGDFRNTVTTGVVSGLGRSLQVSADTVMEGMIQTDAAINHGNSGGPLVNLHGEVVGINTAIIRSASFSGDVAEGLGFSIPSNTVRYVVDQLITKGKVARPYLGVQSTPLTPSLAAYYNLAADHGIYVNKVNAGTPAEQAGIREGDIILSIDQDVIDESHPLINVLSHYETGQKVTVEVNRNGQTLKLDITLGERP